MTNKKINFYFIDGAQRHWSLCTGYPLVIEGVPFKFAVHKRGERWVVTNLETGAHIGDYWKTRKYAESCVKDRIMLFGVERFTEIVNETVKRNGPAPLVEGNGCE